MAHVILGALSAALIYIVYAAAGPIGVLVLSSAIPLLLAIQSLEQYRPEFFVRHG